MFADQKLLYSKTPFFGFLQNSHVDLEKVLQATGCWTPKHLVVFKLSKWSTVPEISSFLFLKTLNFRTFVSYNVFTDSSLQRKPNASYILHIYMYIQDVLQRTTNFENKYLGNSKKQKLENNDLFIKRAVRIWYRRSKILLTNYTNKWRFRRHYAQGSQLAVVSRILQL